MSGWLTPPTTGSYTFWIASDDASELWLSNDHDPGNASLMCYVSGWTNFRDWDANASQQSATVMLVAGQPYNIEALQKEGTGGDHLSVAWSGPGITRQVIDGSYMMAAYPPPPALASNPVTKPAAYERRQYSQILSDAVAAGYGTIEFTKISGSDWLSVTPDGVITGISNHSNTGPNTFIIRVANDSGAFTDLTLNIEVYDMFTGEQGIADLAGIAYFWLEKGCLDLPECGGADLSGDKDVDLEDMAILGSDWMQ